MASLDMEKLVVLNRFQNGLSLLPLVVYVPLGVVLMVLRCFIFVHALLIFYLLSKISFVHNVLLRLMFAVCGLVVTTDGGLQTDRRRLVLVANHVTSLDPFILNLVMHYTLVTEPACCTGDLTHLCSQVTISGEMSKEDSVQFIRKAVEDSRLPLLFFPEGGRANGAYGLFKFRTLPFQLEAAIQPIGIIARRWFFDINVSTMTSPWWADLLLSFFVPFTIYNIKYLPLTEHRESEASEEFSERVQTNLAKGLGVTATELTLSDVKEFVKSKQQGRPATASPLAEAQTPSTAGKSQDTPDQEVVAEKVTSTDPALNVMLQQVQVVLPYASGRAVLCDLEQTRDVDATITNILEGRVNLQQKQTPVQPPSLQKEMEDSTFKAATFSKSASMRQLSLQERKEAMLEAARKRYKEKHGIP